MLYLKIGNAQHRSMDVSKSKWRRFFKISKPRALLMLQMGLLFAVFVFATMSCTSGDILSSRRRLPEGATDEQRTGMDTENEKYESGQARSGGPSLNKKFGKEETIEALKVLGDCESVTMKFTKVRTRKLHGANGFGNGVDKMDLYFRLNNEGDLALSFNKKKTEPMFKIFEVMFCLLEDPDEVNLWSIKRQFCALLKTDDKTAPYRVIYLAEGSRQISKPRDETWSGKHNRAGWALIKFLLKSTTANHEQGNRQDLQECSRWMNDYFGRSLRFTASTDDEKKLIKELTGDHDLNIENLMKILKEGNFETNMSAHEDYWLRKRQNQVKQT